MKRWLRHRRTGPSLSPREQADSWQLISLLLDYPETELTGQLPALRTVATTLPARVSAPLLRYLDHAAGTELRQLQTEYVDTFDVTRKCCLHLTYFLHGDTRNRGVALVQFKQIYRRSGVVLADEDAELPDHLPVVLEFGATVDADAAWKLLNDHRVGIELLRRALVQRDNPWTDVIQALRATLPDLDEDDEVALAKLIAQGPPQEEVGIDHAPYAIDPALDHLRTSPQAGGCAPGQPAGPTSLGPTIEVGARR